MKSNKPGLLFIVNSLGVGGAEKHVVTLLNHLDPGQFRLHLAYLKRNESLLPQLDTSRLDEVTCCDVGHGIQRKGIERLQKIISDRRIDVVVCTNTYSMLYGALARRNIEPRPKLVTVFHTTFLTSYKEKAQMLLYRQFFKRCDLLIYVCENQRRYWHERALASRADAVVHNGVDVDYFGERPSPTRMLEVRRSLGLDPDDFVVGLCSALRPEKAHGDMLQAVCLMRRQGMPVKALFIGDGPERAAIERRIDALDLRGQVRITGIQQDVRPFVECCDVMTLVSRGETFSIAALESMAQSKPLVMTDTGGASEQVLHGQNGFLFDPGDVNALITHLTNLRSKPLRAQMGAAAAERVRKLFTVELMAKGFSARMSDLLDGPLRLKSSSHA